jgi:nucleotide-binding universal stress UspA family protein
MSAGKKLLVPIDGSANSLRALAFVIKRVKKDKRLSMCLLNVQPPQGPDQRYSLRTT